MQNQTHRSNQMPSRIDMVGVVYACRELGVDDVILLDMINQGHLAAYDLGGQIRFKAADVAAAAALLTAV